MSIDRLRVELNGCVKSTTAALTKLIEFHRGQIQTVGLVTRHGATYKANFLDSAPAIRAHANPLLFVEDCENGDWLSFWLGAQQLEVTFEFGWPGLQGDEAPSTPKRDVVGYRSMVNWLLTTGFARSGVWFEGR